MAMMLLVREELVVLIAFDRWQRRLKTVSGWLSWGVTVLWFLRGFRRLGKLQA
jgi:hypothetical protein